MKYENNRSSGKTSGVVPVAWKWKQTLIAASALGHSECWTFEPVRCACCTKGTSYLHWTWTKLEKNYTDQWHYNT